MKKNDINRVCEPLTYIQSLHIVTMLSIRWSTTAESSNRHSSCREIFSSIRAGGGKCEDTARPRVSQRFLMGLKSGEYPSRAIQAIPSLSS